MKSGILQSISTKYIPATNTKGARIKAMASGGESITISRDDSLSTDENHIKAIKALKKKLKWSGAMAYGATKTGIVAVFR